jgi:pimeloyl-ACP methyl ester carboxylesterase
MPCFISAAASGLGSVHIPVKSGENKLAFFAPKHVAIPVAVSVFPDEIYTAPRSWVERAYPKLIHYNKLDKGGHFAAWEQPQRFSEEVRAGFRLLRK